MNPYPFRRLNHFTVPIIMICPRRPRVYLHSANGGFTSRTPDSYDRSSGALRQPSETTHAMAAAMTLEAETSDAQHFNGRCPMTHCGSPQARAEGRRA